MEKRYCKRCGRPLERYDNEYCRGCVDLKDEEFIDNRNDIKEKEEYYTTNNTAGLIKGLATFIAVAGIIVSIIIGLSNGNIIIAVVGSVVSVLSVLLLYAVGEGLQILDDMKTNTEHIRDYLEREKK